jgi:hypothetical protein
LDTPVTPVYRDITNYLRNELGINREFVTEILEKSVANTVKQVISERVTEAFIQGNIKQAIKDVITDPSARFPKKVSTQDEFNAVVVKEVRVAVQKLLEKELTVEFKIAKLAGDV